MRSLGSVAHYVTSSSLSCDVATTPFTAEVIPDQEQPWLAYDHPDLAEDELRGIGSQFGPGPEGPPPLYINEEDTTDPSGAMKGTERKRKRTP